MIAAAMLIPLSCRIVVIVSQYVAGSSLSHNLYHSPGDVSSIGPLQRPYSPAINPTLIVSCRSPIF